MGILYKIIAGINKTEPIFVEREGLLSFPEKLEEVSDYLVFLNHIMTNGIVTKTDDLQKQKNKLQFIIASLNIYRLVEKFSNAALFPVVQQLVEEGSLSEKMMGWINFCVVAKTKYSSVEDSYYKKMVYQDIFDRDTYSSNQECVQMMIDQYPSKKEKGEGEEFRTLSGGPTRDSESSGSSAGREDYISLTNATLRRLLKNYWEAQRIEKMVENDVLSLLWGGSIEGHKLPIERLENAICFLPIEVSFLYDRDTSQVKSFSIGKSRETNTRELTMDEKERYTIIIHNHPRGDTFSLEDIVACAVKQAKEVRAVTIAITYIAHLCLDVPPNEYINQINEAYLRVASNRSIEDDLIDDYEYSQLEINESYFSYLELRGLIRTTGTCSVFPENFMRNLV